MTLLSPSALLLFILLPFMMAFLIWRNRIRQRALRQLADSPLIPSLIPAAPRIGLKSALWLSTFVCLVLALARPVWGEDFTLSESRGVSVIVVLDVSNSMNTQDLAPSRLERAKLAVVDLTQALGGDEVGLILFAGTAFVQFPLTTDLLSAVTFVEAASSQSITRQGTAIEAALRLALDSFNDQSAADKIIVLMTDGENHEGDPLSAAADAAEQDVTIHAIGYGSSEGQPVPILDDGGAVTGFRSNAEGDFILSRLDEGTLQAIAGRTGGLYQRAAADGTDIDALLRRITSSQTENGLHRVERQPIERFGIFLALALIALSLEMIIPPKSRTPPTGTMLLSLLLLSGCAASASERNNAGNDLYNRGSYEQALLAYQAAQVLLPDEPEPYLNAANAFAQIGQIQSAVAAANQALKTADEKLSATIYYNLGNYYFSIGQFDQAVSAYQQTLLRNPDDHDARYNLELALKRIAPPPETPAGGLPTPTSAPSNQGVTPTPEATVAPSPEADANVSPMETLSVDEAERLLDSIQQDQTTLRDRLQPPAPDAPVEKDW